ncbi:DUF3558 family protein [Saccharopolyspora phatthalungensis]|uniref:DUF3558 domain-containing protein n=1 Tax=Saccharopolyspora phatthalungensis TaxID=664693 RepID=A0A840Q3P6_9PSEU|nr:DUF3558 family protein [Saccharopolyspora phatthalungensis]MBB5153358.1 hypothetical protein [Saccharopolyspora phatthalungensis]
MFGLSACTGGGSSAGGGEETSSAPTSASSGSGLAGFNPCTFFKPEELTSFGVSTQSKDFTQVSFQPGCEWTGEKQTIGLQKNAEETVQSLGKGGGFDEFTPTTVAGREAAKMLTAGATGQGVCNYVVSAGGGIVLYQITGAMRDSVADPCGELKKIADQTASRLPE